MSADAESNKMMYCASCGTPEIDDVKLKDCSACKSVRYCGVECQKEHRPQHKRACKKRAAELREEILFKQPESCHLGDCPICCLPLPLDQKKFAMTGCCSKFICNGCNYANQTREVKEKLDHKCPFCRHPTPTKSELEGDRNIMKRVEANDPAATRYVGYDCESEGDYSNAFGYYSKAAELGDIEAHFNLAVMYGEGLGVEKDKKKELHHLEEAAIGGDPFARHNLGAIENENGRADRAVKHWIIAAKLGYDGSLVPLKDAYQEGFVSKEDLAVMLRGHQAAVDATKSPQREEAEVALSQQREAAEAARKDRVK